MASASETLDRIRTGGGHLLLTAQQRLIETGCALDEGRFNDALAGATRLVEKITHLAEAETMMGRLASGHLIVCDAIQPGMKLLEMGTVTEVGGCPLSCGTEACGHMSVTLDGERTVILPRAAEIVVAADV